MSVTGAHSINRYTVEILPLPEDIRAQIIRELADVETRRLPLRTALSWLIVMGLLGGFVRWLQGSLMLAVFLVLVAALAAFSIYCKTRLGHGIVADPIAKTRTATACARHTLRLDGPHRLVFHEHVQLSPGRTFVHDIPNCADHPWDKPVNDAYQAKRLPSRWTWYELDSRNWPQAVVMEGDVITPSVRENFADADEFGEWVDLFGDEWLPENYIAKVDFDDLLRRDEAVRARYEEKEQHES